MTTICPTVLAASAEEYAASLDNVAFAPRIQIDLMDGRFAPTKSVEPAQIYWNDDQTADVHLMFLEPAKYLDTLIALRPSLIILHAESEGDLVSLFDQIQSVDIKAGICLLPETSVDSVAAHIERLDHILVFGGKLGYYGGSADLSQSIKAAQAKQINPEIETGWDGGGNADNALALAQAGIDVINCGSSIQKADNPEQAWRDIQSIAYAK